MPSSKETLGSVLGSSYFQPIADVVDRWFSRPRAKSNAVQSKAGKNPTTSPIPISQEIVEDLEAALE
jgi:hypothetical protein